MEKIIKSFLLTLVYFSIAILLILMLSIGSILFSILSGIHQIIVVFIFIFIFSWIVIYWWDS